jgi:tetratricopeptide (TPR) repeat protein
MRASLLGAALLAFLLVPALVTAGYAASGAGAVPFPGSSDHATEGFLPFLPLFTNISFTGRTWSAQEWYEQGFALAGEERYSEALLAYEKALSLNRSLLNAWYYEGDALFRLGRYGEALLAFGNATAIDPDFVDAYFYESTVYGRLGRVGDEEDALRRGLEAAERRRAAEEARAGTRSPLHQPLSPGISSLGLAIATGLWAITRQDRTS